MKVKSLLFNGDSNIGLHTYVAKDYALVGMKLSDSEHKSLEDVFGVPVHQVSIAGTSLVGVFLVGNSKNLLVPNIIFDSEKKHLDKLGISYEVFDTELTCLGNNIAVNESSAVIHKSFDKKEMKFIKEHLGLDHVEQMTIADVENVGSCIVMNSLGGVVHRFASMDEIKKLKKLFGITFGIGTINMGGPLVRSGVACNDRGFIVGSSSGGPEMVNIDENLRGGNDE